MACWWQNSETIIKEIIKLQRPRCTAGTWSYDNVQFKITDGIAEVKLDDARTGNALRHKTVSALLDICVELHARVDVKAAVFTASGFYFCSGGAFGSDVPDDDAAYSPQRPGASRFEAAVAENLPIAHLLYLMSTLPQYKACAIRGSVLGAGISLVAAMDFVAAPERSRLSFKEATRGLGACCSWQATVAKIGVRAMRRLCLLAEDLDMSSAQRFGLVHEIVPGSAEAQPLADALALAKAQEVLAVPQAKSTGPGTGRLHRCSQGIAMDPAEMLREALSGIAPRIGPARFSMGCKDAEMRITGQHVLELRVKGPDFVDALAELHRTPSGQVRLVQVLCDCPLDDLEPTKVLTLLELLPALVLGLPPTRGRGRQVLLWAMCDVVLAEPQATFDFSGLGDIDIGMEVPEGVIGAAEAEEMGLVTEVTSKRSAIARICEKLSSCAPNAVAQSKLFIHKIGCLPMDLQRLNDLAEHIARRVEDPEFEDSIQALLDKEHVPVYMRPGNKVVPAHLKELSDFDGTVII